jgi:sialate O-acetylesterase
VSSDGLNVTLDGVQVGEVWLCSGQSNMGRPLSSADGSAPYIADAPNHNLRLFRMTANNGPATASWQISNASTAASFSAVGYWMGLDLAESLDVPVGLIQATLDGSDISEWQHTNGGTDDAYDAMVSPILPFALRGVAWYQGESNGGEAAYQTKLTAMIGEWRSDFGTTPLPFGIVQLPATKWSAAKLGQYNVSRTVADTFLVVTADLPGGNQLHPTTKYPVGIRTGVGARGAVYGEAIEYSGPVPAASSFVSGNTVTVNYDHVGNGLTTSNGQAPSTFQVAGSNNQYVSATATLIGNSIEVRSNRVSAPKHVRYGFTGAGNVRNAVNVPTEGGAQTLTSLPGSLYQLDFP